MRITVISILTLFLLLSCKEAPKPEVSEPPKFLPTKEEGVSLLILGTVQDAGSPHIACKKECCSTLFKQPDANRKVVSLGLIDFENEKTFLFEATPDITSQVKELKESATWDSAEVPDGIFLTHAHIGHYAGLMYLGKEAANAPKVPVFAMPKMKTFLAENGPWSQLVKNENIIIYPLFDETEVTLTSNLRVVPFTVPHRDEYSETVGFTIIGPTKTVLFIPDINKWSVWKTSIADVIKTVDYAFVDATFYDGEEINTRDISEIPHPFVIESTELFKDLTKSDKRKIHFIHFNHTNPLLREDSPQTLSVLQKGFQVARKGQVFKL